MSSSLTSSSSSEEAPSASPLASMFDVTCGVDFVIGTGRLKIRQFLGLTRHAVVALDQTAGTDLELRVNGVTLALGEVAVIDDTATIRVTSIAVPTGVGWE